MINLDNCPCCAESWINNHIRDGGLKIQYHCSKCKIDYNPKNKFLMRRDILNKKHLVWDFQLNRCVYGYAPNVIDGNLLELPWLDFNITPEKLKLYLLFS
jgi:hypothetical protein